ncbi:porin [Duganella guangzhouensis]
MKQKNKVVLVMAVAMGTSSTAAMAQNSYLWSRLQSLPEYSGASGATGVSVYGTLDEGINYIKSDNGPVKTQVMSGGEYSSKLGIYGSEDLGGGLKLEFNLESGFQADTGTQQDTNLFNRASWVGLKSRELGTLRFGNQLAASLPLFVDVFGVVNTNSVFTWVGAAAVQTSKGVGYNSDLGAGATTLLTRVPKSVMYQTPRMAGLSGQFMYASNSTTGTGVPRASNQGGVVSYESYPFYLAASYNQVWSGAVTLTTGATPIYVRNDIPGLAVVYDHGDLVLSTSYMMMVPKLEQDGLARIATLGAILPRGRHTWRMSVVHRDTSGVRNTAGTEVASSALGVMLGYDYDLSKRTSLYARVGTVRNFGASTIVFNSNALPLQSGSANPQLGIETRSLTLGMYHHF